MIRSFGVKVKISWGIPSLEFPHYGTVASSHHNSHGIVLSPLCKPATDVGTRQGDNSVIYSQTNEQVEWPGETLSSKGERVASGQR